MTVYDHLYARVEYPRERGYRMEPQPLPDWIRVEIVQQGISKVVIVRSRIHVTKEVQLPTTYSVEFTDREILISVSGEVTRRWISP